MAFKARHYTPHCPRCLAPIEIGNLVEAYYPDGVDGRKTWAHHGCTRIGSPRRSSSESSLANLPSVMTGAMSKLMNNGNAVRKSCVKEYTGDHADDGPETGMDEYQIESMVMELLAKQKGRWQSDVVNDLTGKLNGMVGHLQHEIDKRVRETVEALAPTIMKHEFNFGEMEPVRMEGQVLHPQFDRIVRLAVSRPLHGMSLKPIFFPGPTGCGKTHTAIVLHEYLAKQFPGRFKHFGLFSCTAGMTESDLFGSAVPRVSTGELVYQTTPFVRCFEEGGVFCLDEMDAGDPNVLLKLNAPLAQHRLFLSKRSDKQDIVAHPDFVFIATANTWGTGANRQYCGRNPMDEASLDRLRIGTVPCDYVAGVEKALCPDVELYGFFKEARRKMMESQIKRVISTRFIRDAYEMRCMGDSMDDIKLALFGAWRPEEQIAVLGEPLNQSK